MNRRSFASRLLCAGLLAGLAGPAFSVAPVVIDVRTPQEFSQGHVAGAINLPHDSIAAHVADAVPDRATPVILYCRSGRRSAIALETLRGMGYSKVENYGGLEEASRRIGGQK